MQKNKKTIIAVIVLLVLIAAAVLCLKLFKPESETGSKTVLLTVVDSEGQTVSYAVETEAEFLRQVMDEADGLTYAGDEGPYGMAVETVNGQKAVYTEDDAYWAFYLDANGDGRPDSDEYCLYGIDTQPVNSGESYLIVYEKAW